MNLVDPHAIAKLPAERRHDRWFTPFKPGDPKATHAAIMDELEQRGE